MKENVKKYVEEALYGGQIPPAASLAYFGQLSCLA